MSGRRLRRAAVGAALGLGVVLVTLAILDGAPARPPVWSVPVLVGAVLLVCELADLAGIAAPEAAVERPAVAAAVGGCLLAAALALAAAAVALVAAAIPARYGLATGLLGAFAAGALFLLVGTAARRDA